MSVNSELQRIINAKGLLTEKAIAMGLKTSDGETIEELNNQSGHPLIDELADAYDNINTSTLPEPVGATVTVPAGYYPADTSKTVKKVDKATPAITVSENGLITATVAQEEGYVSGSNKNATKQLPTIGDTTFTPSKESQLLAAEGTYITGDVVVAPIPNNYIDITDSDNQMGSQNANVNGATVSFPAGYYPNGASASVNDLEDESITINALDEVDDDGLIYDIEMKGYVNKVYVYLDNSLENALKEI